MSIKHLIFALAVAIVPVGALATPAQVYIGDLSSANESPPNGSTATGSAIVTYSPSVASLRVQVSFSGLSSGTTASHIHCCIAPGTNAAVATTTPTFAGFPLAVTSGTYDATLDMSQSSSYNPSFITAHVNIIVALNDLLVGLERHSAYLNVHTSNFPGGEIRANLVRDNIFSSGLD